MNKYVVIWPFLDYKNKKEMRKNGKKNSSGFLRTGKRKDIGGRAASLGQSVIIIQFLKGKDAEEFNFLERLEPDIKLFRFEKSEESYDSLLPSQKKEEQQNILNGFNFAKKVIDTGECDVLVLDEVLGLLDFGIIEVSDIIKLIELRDDYTRLVLTGRNLPQELIKYTNVISKIELEKDDTDKM